MQTTTIGHTPPTLTTPQGTAAQPQPSARAAAPQFENWGDHLPDPEVHLALAVAPGAAHDTRPRPNICWEVTKIFLPAIFAAGALAGLLAYFQPDVDPS